jgi:hypothetical protein
MQNQQEFEKIKYEETLEWWRPSKEDGYSLEKKLFRAGCRTIKRKYLECSRNEDADFKTCMVISKKKKKRMSICH